MFLLLGLMAGSNAFSETCPEWASITVTTRDPASTISVQTKPSDNSITQLTIQVSTNLMVVPISELQDTEYVQLHTLRMGYWNTDLRDFYVSLDCGRMNSFPNSKQPQAVTYYFTGGIFSRSERSPVMTQTKRFTEQEAGVVREPRGGSRAPQP